jgi:hypothetical protein
MYTVDWQQLVMLLYALDQLGGSATKREAIDYIREYGIYRYRASDNKLVKSGVEAKWMNDIAWARKDSVRKFVDNRERNSWDLLPEGRLYIKELRLLGQQNGIAVEKCHLWNARFRQVFSKKHQEAEALTPGRDRGYRSSNTSAEYRGYVRSLLTAGHALESIAQRFSAALGFYIEATEESIIEHAPAYISWMADKIIAEHLSDAKTG